MNLVKELIAEHYKLLFPKKNHINIYIYIHKINIIPLSQIIKTVRNNNLSIVLEIFSIYIKFLYTKIIIYK